jgi:hypothetical protein
MSRKKKQSSKKKSTYKPKWAKQQHTPKQKVPMVDDGTSLIPSEGKTEKLVVSKEKLPQEYNPLDNQAYTFPPFMIVVVLIVVIFIIGYLLF